MIHGEVGDADTYMAVLAEQEVSERGLAHVGWNIGEVFVLRPRGPPAPSCGLAHEDCAEGFGGTGKTEEVSDAGGGRG